MSQLCLYRKIARVTRVNSYHMQRKRDERLSRLAFFQSFFIPVGLEIIEADKLYGNKN
jgi:hypothetical protein